MNIFSFTGNLGKDCRIGNAGGTAVCNFNVAVKSGYGEKAQTLWVDCALWGKQAESKLPDYLLKGQQVAVSGELGERDHEGKTYLTCRVSSVDLVGGKTESQPQQRQQSPAPQANKPAPQAEPDFDFDDDVPF
jgi:single-strand DNA-binding protein